jgi:hypothetical protein
VEPEFAELEELEEAEELEELEELEDLEEVDASEESQPDGVGTHTVPPPGAPSEARRPWLRSRLLPAALGAVVVGGLALATARELGRLGRAAPRVAAQTAPLAATVAPRPETSPKAPAVAAPAPVVTAGSGASNASEVAEASRSPPADAPSATVVAVSPDIVSMAASNAALPKASGAARGAPLTAPTELAAFDAVVADAAIQAAFQRAQGCRSPGDPRGMATVTLTYAPSGRVTTALVSGVFAGTSIGSCIAAALRSARIPPFTGALVTVKRSATLT